METVKTSPVIRKLIDDGLYDPNYARNGIALPKTKELASEVGLPVHNGPHNTYTVKVSEEVARVDQLFSMGKIDAKQALNNILHIQNEFRDLIVKNPQKLGGGN